MDKTTKMSKRPTTNCVAFGCNNILTPEGKAAGISFHMFPKDPVIRKKWAVRIRRKNWAPTDYSHICSDHFERECFYKSGIRTRLLPGAEPTLFNFPARLRSKKCRVLRVQECRLPDVAHYAATEVLGTRQAEQSQQTNGGTSITGQECDIPLTTTTRGDHIMNITETLMKFREKGFLCDVVLVAKCGREVKAHSVLLAAVSPVFLMAIKDKPSSGTCHLCFPEVDIDVLEIAVHFIYTGKLLLPTVYAQMDLLSKLFDKLSDLGLSLQKLRECEMIFVRDAKQPSNSSKSFKAGDTDNKTSLNDSVQKLQASCEWPVGKKASSVETMVIDVAPNDAGRSQRRGISVESSPSTLAEQQDQGNREQDRPKGKHRKSRTKNDKDERMPSTPMVPTSTGVRKPLYQRPVSSILRSLLGDLNTSSLHSSGAGSHELHNLQADQNTDKLNALDPDTYGIHEAVVNDYGNPNPKTQEDIFNRVDPTSNEKTMLLTS